MFYDQLTKLCTTRGITVTALLKSLGYSSSKGTAWKNGSRPRAPMLMEIANYFEVPAEYLLSGNVDDDLEYKLGMLKKRSNLTEKQMRAISLPDDFFADKIESESKLPLLNSIFYNDSNYIWCKYCLTWHIHGLSDGHRTAHCQQTTPYKKSGYIIKTAYNINFTDSSVLPKRSSVDISPEALVVAQAYDKAGIKDKNIVRQALDLPLVSFKKETLNESGIG